MRVKSKSNMVKNHNFEEKKTKRKEKKKKH
jgi:hypothetical protein